MFNGKIHYKWSFSIAILQITRGYVFLILFVGMGQNFAAISRPLGWSLRSIDWSSLGVVSPSPSEDPRGMFKWDSRASGSKKRHNESINQWIGLRENLQDSPIFNGKIYGFL